VGCQYTVQQHLLRTRGSRLSGIAAAGRRVQDPGDRPL